MSLGFCNAGIEVVSAYDNWEVALDTYRRNFRHPATNLSLSQVSKAAALLEQQSADLIFGGPPCQDFSIAGKRSEGAQANLSVSFAQIVARVRPKYVVMENVYSIVGSSALNRVTQILSRVGYGITERVIDASRVGVPQMRRRYFLLGSLFHETEAFGAELDSGLTENRTTVSDYFGRRLDIQYYYAHPRNYQRRAIFSVHEPSATIRRVNRPVPKNYKRHPADKVAPSRSLRPLTFEERMEVQTFPRTFIVEGSPSQREHQVANAVPVRLAEYVARALLRVSRRKSRK